MAMMAMTTSNSINVNPVSRRLMQQLSALGQAASMRKRADRETFCNFRAWPAFKPQVTDNDWQTQ
jgi:hypothetical protein